MFARVLAACGLALLLAGCLPDSVHPLAPPEAALDAPELLGLWQTTVEDTTVYLHVLRGRLDERRLQIVTVGHETDGRGDVDAYVGHVSAVGDRRFVNLQDAGEEQGPWWILGYEAPAEGTLTVRFLAAGAMADGVAAGWLDGKIDDDGTVHLAGDGHQIAAFLAESDPAALFGQAMEFRRVGAAAIPQ